MAALLEAVLSGCPTIAVLATSREPLGLDAEQVWPVRSLDPDLEGVELFLERATAADASFTPDDDRVVLVELCRHLDGIPLAIELAAAKVRAMSPAEVLDRLSDRFRLLRGGARRGMDRHRTLAATLDWSYDLLSAEQQRLLDRLCVFAGSFDLAALEAVCLAEGLDGIDALDAVTSLVDKSMIEAERRSSGTRYRLLETVRQYAEGHLVDQGHLADLRLRHLAYYLAVAESAGAGVRADFTSGQIVFDREWDNVRAATQTALAIGDSHSLGRMFTAIGLSALSSLRYEAGDWAEAATRLRRRPCGQLRHGGVDLRASRRLREMRGSRPGRDRRRVRRFLRRNHSCWSVPLCRTHPIWPAQGRPGGDSDAASAWPGSPPTPSRKPSPPPSTRSGPCRSIPLGRRSEPDGQRNSSPRAIIPLLRSEVLGNLGRYYSLIGEPARAIECCRESVAQAEEHHLLRNLHHARNALAQIAARGRWDDAAPGIARRHHPLLRRSRLV